ncbi:hypothetical protein B0H11DRAFT_2048499 [Mycena galericulata]|nr:hypothetical protein B0H11DRAFT_2048499 [Mycena galericulata]
MLFTTTVLGYLVTYGSLDWRIPYIMGILTNVILMALTAGRIWWSRRDARVLSESAFIRTYNTVIAIMYDPLLLSGIGVGSNLLLHRLDNTVFLAALPQIVNIAPTLIIVRVGLGRAFEDTARSEHGGKVFPRVRQNSLSTFVIRAPATSAIIDIRATREDENVSLPEHDERAYELRASSQGPSGAIGFGTEVP